jgi:hypothetical protein
VSPESPSFVLEIQSDKLITQNTPAGGKDAREGRSDVFDFRAKYRYNMPHGLKIYTTYQFVEYNQ